MQFSSGTRPMGITHERGNREGRSAGDSAFRLCLVFFLLIANCSARAALRELPAGATEVRGKVSGTTIEGPDGQTHNVVQDEKGKDFCQTMRGVTVRVFGEAVENGPQSRLRIIDYVDERMTAAHELWRRMRCNACAVQAADVLAAPPPDTHGATPVSGRYYSFKDRILASHRDGDTQWVATDNRIVRIDLATKKIATVYDRSNGLPDHRVHALLAHNGTLWIVHRRGVAVLDSKTGSIRDLPELRVSLAALCTEGDHVWIVADTGTRRYSSPDAIPEPMPALPTGALIGRTIENGIWLPHWRRKTEPLLSSVAACAGNVYAESLGTIYGLEDGQWRRVAANGWHLRQAANNLWFLSTGQLGSYDPKTRKLQHHDLPDAIAKGRATYLRVESDNVWVAVVPPETQSDNEQGAGGLAAFNLRTETWSIWQDVGEHSLRQITCLARAGDELWVAARQGRYVEKPAHPGMTYVKRRSFQTDELCLHRLNPVENTWLSLPLTMDALDTRLICGQDGASDTDTIGQETIERLAVAKQVIFAQQHLYADRFFSGYWPSVSQVARRSDQADAWAATMVHRPDELGLQGEQPLVLNISNKGEMVLPAVGHDDVLDLFVDEADTAWTVTEGAVAYYDAAGGRWQSVYEGTYRWYWRATAAVETDESLFIGSDRGLLGRLDPRTGLFSVDAIFKDRAVAQFVTDSDGNIVAVAKQAVLGQLPSDVPVDVSVLDGDFARWDGGKWMPLHDGIAEKRKQADRWVVRKVQQPKRPLAGTGRDKSDGNFLHGLPANGGNGSVPRFYLKDVFWPKCLCEGAGGTRLWISTFSGMLRVDVSQGQ